MGSLFRALWFFHGLRAYFGTEVTTNTKNLKNNRVLEAKQMARKNCFRVLLNGNGDQRTIGNWQRATGNEQLATGNGNQQRATCNGRQRATGIWRPGFQNMKRGTAGDRTTTATGNGNPEGTLVTALK